MKLIGQMVALLFGVSLLAATGFGVYLGLQYVVALFAALDPQVASVTGIGCVVALTAAWGVSRGLRTAIRESKAMTLREEKTATYQLFVDFWKNLLRQERASTDPLPADLSERLQLLDRLLALYGAAAVIKAHTALRALQQARNQDLRPQFAKALVEIRKDLGSDSLVAEELRQLLLPASGEADSETVPADPRIGEALGSNA